MALTTPPPNHVVASTGAGGGAETNAGGEGGAVESTTTMAPLPRLDHIPEEIVQILQQPAAKDSGMNKLGEGYCTRKMSRALDCLCVSTKQFDWNVTFQDDLSL